MGITSRLVDASRQVANVVTAAGVPVGYEVPGLDRRGKEPGRPMSVAPGGLAPQRRLQQRQVGKPGM